MPGPYPREFREDTVWVMCLSGATLRVACTVVLLPLVSILLAWTYAVVGREWVGQTPYVLSSWVLCALVAVVSGTGVLRALRH